MWAPEAVTVTSQTSAGTGQLTRDQLKRRVRADLAGADLVAELLAARRWRPGEGLSLADRLCLALAERAESTVWTADGHWADEPRARPIRGSPRLARSRRVAADA